MGSDGSPMFGLSWTLYVRYLGKQSQCREIRKSRLRFWNASGFATVDSAARRYGLS